MKALDAFSTLPLRERLFVRARLFSAPMRRLAGLAPSGRVADIGCGHGLLSALLAEDASREVTGIDPDERKIAWAQKSVGRLANAKFQTGTVESLRDAQRGTFDGVVVADVLYLLPFEQWAGFVLACAELLRPGGTLLLKEAEDDGSWRYWKCLAQEELMVRLLRRTRSSGGLGFKPRRVIEALIHSAGLKLEQIVSLADGYTTPHVLFVARR